LIDRGSRLQEGFYEENKYKTKKMQSANPLVLKEKANISTGLSSKVPLLLKVAGN
jgi:hypothetical protein